MKKRILALLLAGVITASMVSCVSSSDGGRNDKTEPNQTRVEDPNNNPNTVTWTDVNETVYVVAANLSLIAVDSGNGSISVPQMTKLTRVQVGSNTKSVVEKDGVRYYADSKSLTNADLTGETFVPCDAPKTMYIASDDVSVRKYATREYSFSTVIEKKMLNDTVTVVAIGENWVKIQYDAENQYFVSADWVSDAVVVNVNDINNYPKFNELAASARFDLYVVAESLALRYCPSTEAKVVNYLTKGAKLTVLAQATVEGTVWYQVAFAVQGGEGQGADNVFGYVAQSKYVSTDSSASTTITLEDMLKDYPYFTPAESAQTMYVSADSLNVRLTPALPEDDESNKVQGISFTKTNEVKVVATGTNDGVFWAMIQVEEGKFYFVSHKWLTTDPAGNPAPMSLAQLLATYSDFTELSAPKTMYAAKTVNCNTIPSYQDEVETKLQAGDAVTVVAQGEVRLNTWYIFKTADGLYFFAGADLFTETKAA